MDREWKVGDFVRITAPKGSMLLDGTHAITEGKKYALRRVDRATVLIHLDNGITWWISKRAIKPWIQPIFVAEKEV